MILALACSILQRSIPDGLSRSMDAFFAKPAHVHVEAWTVISRGRKVERPPTHSIDIFVSGDNLRVEDDSGHGVWIGTEGAVTHIRHGKESFINCRTKREVLAAYGLDDLLMGPQQNVKWSPMVRLQSDEVGDKWHLPPPFYAVGFHQDGDHSGMHWELEQPGGMIQQFSVHNSKGRLQRDKYFFVSERQPLYEDPNMFAINTPVGSVQLQRLDVKHP